MIGLISHIKGRKYRIADFVVLSLNLTQERFLLEGTGYIFSHLRIKEGIEYEFIVAEFDQPTEKISKENDFAERECDFLTFFFSEENQWRLKRQEFHILENILKKRGEI